MGDVGFGDIRAIMSREPELAWRQLGLAAARYEDEREWREVVVPYLVGHTSGWPAGAPELRVEREWVTDFTMHGRVHPLWRVCTTLELHGEERTRRLFDRLAERELLGARRLVIVGDMRELAWRSLGARGDVSFDELVVRDSGQAALALDQLAKGEWFCGLRRLEVSGGRMGRRGVDALVRADMVGLESLALDACSMGAGALRALASPAWASELSALSLTDRTGRAWRSRAAQSMRELHVPDDELTDVFEGMFEEVRSLTLDGVELSGRAGALAGAIGPRLEEISCAGCRLTDGDLVAMVEAGVFERARSVDLSMNAFGEVGAGALARQQMPGLKRLRVWPTPSLDRAEAEAFAMRGVWSDGVRASMLEDLERDSGAHGRR